jgi:hypothetical protein
VCFRFEEQPDRAATLTINPRAVGNQPVAEKDNEQLKLGIDPKDRCGKPSLPRSAFGKPFAAIRGTLGEKVIQDVSMGVYPGNQSRMVGGRHVPHPTSRDLGRLRRTEFNFAGRRGINQNKSVTGKIEFCTSEPNRRTDRRPLLISWANRKVDAVDQKTPATNPRHRKSGNGPLAGESGSLHSRSPLDLTAVAGETE